MDQNRREFLKGAGIAAAITAMGGLTAGRVDAQFVKTCKIKIGYDDNLGLPNDFPEAIGCEITAYHDLGQMIDEFVKQNLSGLFIPAGALPYIKQYDIVSQAQFGSENKITLKAFFVTTRNIAVQDVANSSIGRVNQYCTTSFWAPLIYLMDFLPRNTSLKFQDTDGFQNMLNTSVPTFS